MIRDLHMGSGKEWKNGREDTGGGKKIGKAWHYEFNECIILLIHNILNGIIRVNLLIHRLLMVHGAHGWGLGLGPATAAPASHERQPLVID